MYLETITTERDTAAAFEQRSGLFDEPPAGLLAAISWEHDDARITTLVLWESPRARGDFAYERVLQRFDQEELTESESPERLTPARVHVRGVDVDVERTATR